MNKIASLLKRDLSCIYLKRYTLQLFCKSRTKKYFYSSSNNFFKSINTTVSHSIKCKQQIYKNNNSTNCILDVKECILLRKTNEETSTSSKMLVSISH